MLAAFSVEAGEWLGEITSEELRELKRFEHEYGVSARDIVGFLTQEFAAGRLEVTQRKVMRELEAADRDETVAEADETA